jgi:hypothetical protein
MTKKELRKIAIKKLDEGKTRQQVLTEIREETQAPAVDIARILTFTPSKRTKKKYKLVNSILLGILILTIILKFTMGIPIVLENGIKWLPILFLLPLINILLAYKVATYQGNIYKWIAILTIVSLLRSAPKLFNEEFDFLKLVDLTIAGLIIFLGFYLKGKFAADYEIKREYYINDLGERRGRDVILFNN